MSESTSIGPLPVPALNDFPADQPLLMVNLLKFREPDGLSSYLRYGEAVRPFLERVGASVRYGGANPAAVVGDTDKPWWDVILVVEYPNPAAFLEMVTGEDYNAIHVHRADALERAELIATSAWNLEVARA